MPSQPTGGDAVLDARSLTRKLVAYRAPSTTRSVLELAITVVPFLAIWAAMLVAVDRGYWVASLLTLPAAGLLVRLFIIQHDCGHRSFLPDRRANDWIGHAIGVLTMTPYDYWRRDHALHHASSGNLDHRGFGDIETLTVDEFRARTFFGRLRYRLYRHPAVMFGLGPAYQFVLRHRFPAGMVRADRQVWISVMATNAALAVLATATMLLVGVVPFLVIHVPIVLLAASIGVWLFYVQHQFETTSWDPDEDWTFHEAALHGSSHYDLPGVLRWFTGNIGVHHVHHLSSTIPFYRLPEVLRDRPELVDVGRLTLRQSLKSVPLVLWDEEKRRLISFRQMRARLSATTTRSEAA